MAPSSLASCPSPSLQRTCTCTSVCCRRSCAAVPLQLRAHARGVAAAVVWQFAEWLSSHHHARFATHTAAVLQRRQWLFALCLGTCGKGAGEGRQAQLCQGRSRNNARHHGHVGYGETW